MSTTATVGALLCEGGAALRAGGLEAPRREARALLAHATGRSREALLADRRATVAPGAAATYRALLARRATDRAPMAHLTGAAGFWTLDLHATPDTLIPRADTETLVEAALDLFPDRNAPLSVLDLGTGTGALLLAVLAERPRAWGVGVDRAPAAASLAHENAARNGLSDRAAFLAGDWAGALDGRFDLVLANPPYIESAAIPALMPEVAQHEPRLALDGGADGLDAYRALARDLPRLLAPGVGRAILELGAGQTAAVSAITGWAGLDSLACRADLGGVARALVLAPKGLGGTGRSR